MVVYIFIATLMGYAFDGYLGGITGFVVSLLIIGILDVLIDFDDYSSDTSKSG